MITVKFTPEKWEAIRNHCELTDGIDYEISYPPAQLASLSLDGEINPLEAYIEIKRLSNEISQAEAVVKDLAINEADKYPSKSFSAFGAQIEKRNGPSTWDYSSCAAHIQAKERLKYIEKIAQAGGGADANTGEEIGKAIKIEGKSTIAVKI